MKIDAHHHFWNYSATEYGWIDDAMSVIRRDFLPSELAKEIHDVGIDGVVSVQARQHLEETRWLLAIAAENEFIKGVVGWIPLADPSVQSVLESIAGDSKLRGVRHLVQSEPDHYLLRKDFNSGVCLLRELDIAYDVLIYERQLPEAILFVDQHPEQVFVLDHLGKPRVRDRLLDPWRKNLKELAQRENVFCKISGLVTEAEYTRWSVAQLRPYFETALEVFGPARLMFGTDWPVCLVACSYRQWYDVVRQLSASLSAGEQSNLFGGTAIRAYRLPAS